MTLKGPKNTPKITVIGAGHVGLVTAVCLAQIGNTVICVDKDKKRIRALKKGIIPFYEPGLKELVIKNTKTARLTFAYSVKEAVEKSLIIFICVGTPARSNGNTDLSAVKEVARCIAPLISQYRLIVEKSTVPAGTCYDIKKNIEAHKPPNARFDIVYNPEFLREGRAISDALYPSRIILGVETKDAERIMRRLYRRIKTPIIVSNIPTAEIIKHACNCFLATKISFINSIALLCEKVGADVKTVVRAMETDKRIGRGFLGAGAGFGGPCLPKDLDAFINLATRKGYKFELFRAVRNVNTAQRKLVFTKIKETLGVVRNKNISILGLSFKPDTDDIRNSVSIEIIRMLLKTGAKIKAYDPKGMAAAKHELKTVTFCASPYEAARGCDCLVIMTEWKEFKKIDFLKIRSLLKYPIIIDARNLLNRKQLCKIDFIYKGIGQPPR